MHSSRMRTARSSSRPGGVSTRHSPWEQTPPGPGTLLQGMLGYHLQCMLG